jgi:hypothetical protein
MVPKSQDLRLRMYRHRFHVIAAFDDHASCGIYRQVSNLQSRRQDEKLT